MEGNLYSARFKAELFQIGEEAAEQPPHLFEKVQILAVGSII
jgi:hypothetical protein